MTLQERMHAKSLGSYLSCLSALDRNPLALSTPAAPGSRQKSSSAATGLFGTPVRQMRAAEKEAERNARLKLKADAFAIPFSSRNQQTPDGEPMTRLAPRW